MQDETEVLTFVGFIEATWWIIPFWFWICAFEGRSRIKRLYDVRKFGLEIALLGKLYQLGFSMLGVIIGSLLGVLAAGKHPLLLLCVPFAFELLYASIRKTRELNAWLSEAK